MKILDNISFTLGREDKVAFVGGNERAKTVLFQILMGEMEPDEGTYKWGVTTSQSYFPKDNTKEFDNDLTIADWLTGYSEIKDATYVRGFLGTYAFPRGRRSEKGTGSFRRRKGTVSPFQNDDLRRQCTDL